MVTCSFRKHQGVPAGGLVPLLVALVVVVGLSLPGGAAAQQQGQGGDKDAVNISRVQDDCTLPSQRNLFRCASGQEDVTSCCRDLKFEAEAATDCGCGLLKVIEGRGIDLNNVCNIDTTAAAKRCEDAAEEARKAQEEMAAKEREDKLSSLDPCERLFERLGGGETSKITPEDARSCFQTMKTCAASCQKQ